MLARAASASGNRLLRVSGLTRRAVSRPRHHPRAFPRWRAASTTAATTAAKSWAGLAPDLLLSTAATDDAGLPAAAPPSEADVAVVVDPASLADTAAAATAADLFPWDSVTGPITLIQHSLAAVQAGTGMPWWVTFTAASFALRVALLPTTIYALRNAERMARAGPDLARLNQAYVEASLAMGPKATFAQRRDKMWENIRALRLVYKKHQFHPFKQYVPFFTHFPVFLACVYSIRGMIMQEPAVFSEAGALWFTNLAAADPNYALPVTAVGLTLLNLERMKSAIVKGLKPGTPAPIQARLIYILGTGGQYALLGFSYLTAQMPAGFFFFWIASGVWQLGYSFAMEKPAFRAMLLSGPASPSTADATALPAAPPTPARVPPRAKPPPAPPASGA